MVKPIDPGGYLKVQGPFDAKKATAAAVETVDPYDPAAFNNQTNAPTVLPTSAARVLKGEK